MITLFTAVATSSAGEQGASVMSLGAMMEMLLWLAVVIGIILLCAWGFRRLNGGVMAPTGIIKVRSVISVGNRERVVLLEVGDKQLLIGVCANQINTLHVFEEPVVPLSKPGEGGSRVSSEFATKLQGLLNKDQAK